MIESFRTSASDKKAIINEDIAATLPEIEIGWKAGKTGSHLTLLKTDMSPIIVPPFTIELPTKLPGAGLNIPKGIN